MSKIAHMLVNVNLNPDLFAALGTRQHAKRAFLSARQVQAEGGRVFGFVFRGDQTKGLVFV